MAILNLGWSGINSLDEETTTGDDGSSSWSGGGDSDCTVTIDKDEDMQMSIIFLCASVLVGLLTWGMTQALAHFEEKFIKQQKVVQMLRDLAGNNKSKTPPALPSA